MGKYAYKKPTLFTRTLGEYLSERNTLETIHLFDKSPDRLIAYQTAALKCEIQESTLAIRQMEEKICSSLDSGIELLSSHLKESNYQLGELTNSLNSLYSMTEDKFDTLIYLHRETNTLLSSLKRILLIPEKQKESFSYLHTAITFYKAALREGFKSDHYKTVASNLFSAIELDDTNYVSHFYLAQVYLNSEEFLNVELSKVHFLKSAELAKIFALSETPMNTALMQGIYRESQTDLAFEAALALVFASKCALLLEQYDEAIKYSNEAMQLQQSWAQPIFFFAKALVAKGSLQDAVDAMRAAIKIDRFQVYKVLRDKALREIKGFQEMISDLSQKAQNELADNLKLIPKIDRPNWPENNTLELIYKLQNKGSFLHAKKANDLLVSTRGNWQIKKVFYRWEDLEVVGGGYIGIPEEKELDKWIELHLRDNSGTYFYPTITFKHGNSMILQKDIIPYENIGLIDFIRLYDIQEVANSHKITPVCNYLNSIIRANSKGTYVHGTRSAGATNLLKWIETHFGIPIVHKNPPAAILRAQLEIQISEIDSRVKGNKEILKKDLLHFKIICRFLAISTFIEIAIFWASYTVQTGLFDFLFGLLYFITSIIYAVIAIVTPLLIIGYGWHIRKLRIRIKKDIERIDLFTQRLPAKAVH